MDTELHLPWNWVRGTLVHTSRSVKTKLRHSSLLREPVLLESSSWKSSCTDSGSVVEAFITSTNIFLVVFRTNGELWKRHCLEAKVGRWVDRRVARRVFESASLCIDNMAEVGWITVLANGKEYSRGIIRAVYTDRGAIISMKSKNIRHQRHTQFSRAIRRAPVFWPLSCP